MEFNEIIENRKTCREWTGREGELVIFQWKNPNTTATSFSERFSN